MDMAARMAAYTLIHMSMHVFAHMPTHIDAQVFTNAPYTSVFLDCLPHLDPEFPASGCMLVFRRRKRGVRAEGLVVPMQLLQLV